MNGGTPVYQVHVIDHDRALFDNGLVLAKLYQMDRQEPFTFLHSSIVAGLFKRMGVTLERAHLEAQIARIKALPRADLAGFVSDIPNALLQPDEKTAVEDILYARAQRLDTLVAKMCDHFTVSASFV